MKNPFLSKTVWVAIVQGLVGVLTALMANDPTIQTIGGVLLAKSALDLVIRILTTDPLDI